MLDFSNDSIRSAFLNIAEALGVYTSEPALSAEEIRLNAINTLHNSLGTDIHSVAESCSHFANSFHDAEQKYDACCAMYDCESYDFNPIHQAQDNENFFSSYGYFILFGLTCLAFIGMAFILVKKSMAIHDEYSDLGSHCSLKGKAHGKNTAFAGFMVYFEEILNKYEGINSELSNVDKTHLETTLKSLLKYYFWKNNKTPTDTNMRIGLLKELSLLFHPDKLAINKPTAVLRFSTLMGENDLSTIFKMINEVALKQPNFSDNPEGYREDQKYLSALPNLTKALRIHREIKPIVEIPYPSDDELDDFDLYNNAPGLQFKKDTHHPIAGQAAVEYGASGSERAAHLQKQLFNEIRFW